MPEFDVLLADADRYRILHWTLKQGAVLVPDLHYLEPHYEEIRSTTKLEPFLSSRQFYVLRGDWQLEKLHMKPYVNKFKGAGFYVAQRYGGPYVSYLLYPQRGENGRSILGRGSLDYYPLYYSISHAEPVIPGVSLKEFYAAATRVLKKESSRIKGKVRSVWVAEEATRLLTANLAFLPEPWNRANDTPPP
jgi:hypothetical protein